MISEAIKKIVNKEDLTYDESYMVMNEIMDGATTATQNAAFLAALSTKSTRAETIDEICGCAQAMRASPARSHKFHRWFRRAYFLLKAQLKRLRFAWLL